VTRPAIAVVLVTFDGTRYLDRLWASLHAQRYPADRTRLIVVENGPEQLAARWFAEHAPEAHVLVPGTNTGYAGGNALGMAQALGDGVDHVVVVTQDTVLEPDALGDRKSVV